MFKVSFCTKITVFETMEHVLILLSLSHSTIIGYVNKFKTYKYKQSTVLVTSYWLRKIWSCWTLILKSVSLNSYGIFQPRGPNFLRSWTRAWKKQSPKTNFLKFIPCLQLSKNSGLAIGSLVSDLWKNKLLILNW